MPDLIALGRIGETRLYGRVEPDPRYVLFLLWDETGTPPDEITVDETWSERGDPARTGWYVFTDAAKADPAFEAELRAALPAPVRTGFAWTTGGSAEFAAIVRVVAGANDAPVVAEDVEVKLPPGAIGISFVQGAPVGTTPSTSGGIGGFTFGYPPTAGGLPAGGSGIAVCLTGGDAGIIAFTGFIPAFGSAAALTGAAGHATARATITGKGRAAGRARRVGQEAVRKSLVAVRIDPVRPTGRRNSIKFLGRDYLFQPVGDGYRLVPVD